MKLAYFFVSYPGNSQTFLQREILGLARLGFTIEIYALLHGGPATPDSVPPQTQLHIFRPRDWAWAFVGFLRYGLLNPLRLWRGVRLLLRYTPTFAENWRHTLLGVVFALAQAGELRRKKVDHFHAAWATAPATAAAILADILHRPFSFGAQAYDIYRHGGDAFLVPKMRAAHFIHTTTQMNVRYLSERCPEAAGKIRLIRRGLTHLPTTRDYTALTRPARILSVARLLPKKGHRFQFAAAALLMQKNQPFELRLVGDGPLLADLKSLAQELGIAAQVHFCGTLGPSEVRALYQWADLFWHTGVIDAEGDRDGLPNVVPEAFSFGLPVISSRIGAVTEAVSDRVTGWLIDPEKPAELADATHRLIHDPAERSRLGLNGRAWVEQNFLSENNSRQMAEAFRG